VLLFSNAKISVYFACVTVLYIKYLSGNEKKEKKMKWRTNKITTKS